MTLNLVQLFFSGVGRIGRFRFLIAIAVVILAFDLYQRLGALAHWTLGWVFWPLWLAAAASLLSKRLHDRGQAGWWSAPIILSFILVWPCPVGWGEVWLLVLVWAAFDLALLPGDRHFNRFGPTPP